jgi:hypothetical protein
MDTLSAFVNDITSFELNIPLWLKVGIILVLLISLLVGSYFVKDTFDIAYLKDGFGWFIFVAVVNLSTILVIFYYYGRKNNSYVGPSGVRGKKGKRGKKGTSVSCSYKCKRNIYIQSVRKTDIICVLSTYTNEFKSIDNNYSYFETLINSGNNIDYTSFLNNIIIENGEPVKKTSRISQIAVDKFKELLEPKAISILLIKTLNDEITTASEYTYGTIRSPVPKVGYIALGNSVYGGTESSISGGKETFNLNSFVVTGDVMYPSGYNKLVSFQSYNEITGDYDKYTLWSSISQTVNEPAFGGGTEQHSYLPLGDMCSFGDNTPKINDFAMIKDTCLDAVSSKELKLIFIYMGNIDIKSKQDDGTSIDYTQDTTYLIENTLLNDIEFFSVWRTPMNTFITNCNSKNKLVNNSIMFNVLNGLDDAMNEYGNISSEYKLWVNEKLNAIPIPQFTIALIYTAYFELESAKELIYYMNKYQSKVPKFKDIDFNTMKIGKLLQLIKDTQKEYDDFNKELIKNASISLRGSKTIVYDEKNEKYLPKMVTQIYDNINNKLATLPVQIENSSTLLDVVNYVLPNGLQGRVAVDSEGIAEGGLFLNYIQEMIIRLCKIIFPPNRTTYMIKDECLGTFAKDNEKEELIKDLTNVRNKYNKLIDNITKDYNKYQSQIPTIKIYEDASMKKMGMLCGNIPDYLQKIQSMNMDEFTISRIKGLINIYNETNDYLEKIVKNASSTSDEREEFTKELVRVKDKFIELNAIINNNSAKYQSKMQAVNNYINNFNAKVRKVCTGISNYMEHLNTNNFYKFSTSMIKSLVNIYYEVNNNLNNIIKST